MLWSIKVLYPSGNAKSSYGNSGGLGTGGIINKIEWEVDPNGDCLEGSFEGVPNQLNIAPMDLVQIEVDGKNKFFGYVYSCPNSSSGKRGVYKLIGTKKLLYNTVITDFIMPSSELNLSDIINSVINLRPSFVAGSDIGSFSMGVKGPFYINLKKLGDVLDELSKISNGRVSWGISADRKLFFKEKSSTPINLSGANNRIIKLTEQNVEAVVTDIVFTFSVPKSLGFISDNWEIRSSQTSYNANQSFSGEFFDIGKFKPITYSYTSPLAADYGKLTRIVPLILSDTWMKSTPFKQYLESRGWTLDVGVHNDGLSTGSGANDKDSLINAFNSDTDYVKNVAGSAVISGMYVFASHETPQDLEGIIGLRSLIQVNHSPQEGIRVTQQNTLVYAQANAADKPSYNNLTQWIATKELKAPEKFDALSVIRKHALEYNRIGINQDNNYKVKRLGFGYQIYSNNPDEILPDSALKVSGLKIISLNIELLDEYARSLIRVPTAYPAELSTDIDYGISGRATYDGHELDISKIRYSLSKASGYILTYYLGFDPEKQDNQLNLKIQNRNNSATIDAVMIVES